MQGSIYEDSRAVRGLLSEIEGLAERLSGPAIFMEVCGTHTHAIGAAGLRTLLPRSIRLVSGPGCPVCVTPVGYLDVAEALAARPGVTLCTFGDLYRVPSSTGSLEQAAAQGRDIRIVYSPRDALEIAAQEPERQVIFLSIGFETTTPTIAAALSEAESARIPNFMILPGNKTVPEALHALAQDPDVQLSGLLLPGHVSVIVGSDAYGFLADRYQLPAVVAGFAPTDVLRGVRGLVRQVVAKDAAIENLYGRVVTPPGNRVAQDVVGRWFEPCDANWRGLGVIPGSGLRLSGAAAHRDASLIPVEVPAPQEPAGCRCGDVLKGMIEPPECPLFASGCTPDVPVGACMVSSEGSCAAWYRHERHRVAQGLNDRT